MSVIGPSGSEQSKIESLRNLLVTLETSQLPILALPPLLNFSIVKNISFILVTLETSQAPMFWLSVLFIIEGNYRRGFLENINCI